MEKQLPMSFEEFKKTINQLKQEDKYIDKCSAIGFDGLVDFIPSYDIVIDLLSLIFKDDGEWLSWWVYETEFGNKPMGAWDKDNQPIPDLETTEGIYNLLINNYRSE